MSCCVHILYHTDTRARGRLVRTTLFLFIQGGVRTLTQVVVFYKKTKLLYKKWLLSNSQMHIYILLQPPGCFGRVRSGEGGVETVEVWTFDV